MLMIYWEKEHGPLKPGFNIASQVSWNFISCHHCSVHNQRVLYPCFIDENIRGFMAIRPIKWKFLGSQKASKSYDLALFVHDKHD